MKDLYQIDRQYVLKGQLKGLAEEIRTVRKQKRALLRYAGSAKPTQEHIVAQANLAAERHGWDGDPTPAEARRARDLKQTVKLARVPAHTPEKRAELRTLACHLGEIAPSQKARAALLAYMWLRQKPYVLAEQSTREDNKAPAELIAIVSFVGRHYGDVALAQRVVEIRTWLIAKPAAEQAETEAVVTHQSVEIPA